MTPPQQQLQERLQRSLAALAGQDREHIVVGPFDAFVDHLRPPKYYSFAVPRPSSPGAGLAAALAPLRTVYAERGRNARTEFIETLAPDLEGLLVADGWTLSERMPVMVCTPASFAEPLPVEGLTLEVLDETSPEASIRGFLEAQRVAFRDDSPITGAEIARWRERAAAAFDAVGLLGDTVAGTAFASPVVDGVSEIGGVATPPEFRRRGIASVVTAAAVSAAFRGGAELAWLTAAGESAQGIYARAGFEVVGTLLAYDAPG